MNHDAKLEVVSSPAVLGNFELRDLDPQRPIHRKGVRSRRLTHCVLPVGESLPEVDLAAQILKKRQRDENDFEASHRGSSERAGPAPHRGRKKHLIEMEKRYFGKLSFRADPAMHAEQFRSERDHQRRTGERWFVSELLFTNARRKLGALFIPLRATCRSSCNQTGRLQGYLIRLGKRSTVKKGRSRRITTEFTARLRRRPPLLR